MEETQANGTPVGAPSAPTAAPAAPAAPMASAPTTNPVNDHFAGGATSSAPGGSLGSGAGMHVASSLAPPVNTSAPAMPGPTSFTPGSVLELPNVIRPVNGSSQSTYNQAQPQMAMMRSTTGER